MFAWRCYKDTLPTNKCLAIRIPHIHPICAICSREDETIMHALFHSSWASKVWDASKLPIANELSLVNNMVNLLELLRFKLTVDKIRLLWVIAWRIWYGGNAFIFRGEDVYYQGIVPYCGSYIREVDGSCSGETLTSQAIPNVWHPPLSHTIKLNYDGAYSECEGLGGAGVVVRNVRGLVLVAASWFYPYAMDPYSTEALAILLGMELAVRQGWKSIVIESDAETVINEILSNSPSLSSYGNVVEKIKSLTPFVDCHLCV
ncbi:RVT_3 domain-containing protein/zf-RVT domain-containing protein [Cephalotus follicularis]|uniref:RVT_3 domain-containing protein/zf-RVT domain-containing protein n=1 Tax=Cephalotus follicularis TaxID=3775 RepID=A0A1Q3CNA3_CEPFO|nr:RVT_3 domain-containing protein/zf-RVT domain-containing protein [Cephalotus follicularis]